MKNVFSGDNAVLDYLNPTNNPYIPLVEIPKNINPFREEGVRIFAKLMHTLPLLNIKSLPAFNMLTEADKRNELDGVNTIIENSSGNTVMSLSIIGNLMGINNTKAYVSHEVTEGKLKLLQLFGVIPMVNKEPICPDPSDKTSGIYKSKKLGRQSGWFNAGQYDNSDNPKAHEKWTGKQLWEQTRGEISIFCSSLGTTGTMVGAGSYLKRKNPNLLNIGVVRSPNNPVPGPRIENLLRQIAFDWRGIVDSLQSVGTVDSYKYSLQLIRNGILAGPSSGFNFKGLLKFFKEKLEDGELDKLRNEKGEVIAVFITCDTPLPYIDEYFRYLDEESFPEIENRELLINAYQEVHQIPASNNLYSIEIQELSQEEAYKRIFSEEPELIWKMITKNELISTNKKVAIIDIRKSSDFDHFHIPNAINLQEDFVEKNLNYLAQKYKSQEILVYCYRGNSSQRIAGLLKSVGLQAFSVQGGMIEYSEKNLPRWRPSICNIKH